MDPPVRPLQQLRHLPRMTLVSLLFIRYLVCQILATHLTNLSFISYITVRWSLSKTGWGREAAVTTTLFSQCSQRLGSLPHCSHNAAKHTTNDMGITARFGESRARRRTTFESFSGCGLAPRGELRFESFSGCGLAPSQHAQWSTSTTTRTSQPIPADKEEG